MAGYEVRGVPQERMRCRVQGRALNLLPHCTCCACLNSPCGSVYRGSHGFLVLTGLSGSGDPQDPKDCMSLDAAIK